MKFASENANRGIVTVKAQPQVYDGYPPLPGVSLKWPNLQTCSDRFAVASALLFSPWSAGTAEFDREISALTASRLCEWYATVCNVWFSASPVLQGGLPIPRGAMRASLVTERECQVDKGKVSPGSPEREHLSISFSDLADSTTWDANNIRIASNVEVLCRPIDRRFKAYVYLGLSLLIAESCGINEIRYSELNVASELERVATVRLLESVSMGLSID